MNAFLQLLIEPKPGELRRALETLVSTLPFQGKLTAVWLNRPGKRAVKKWSTLKAEENWPVGTDELMLTTDKVRVGKLLDGQLRILTIVSPHDENWAASKDTISHSLEVRGVQMNRRGRESALDYHKTVQWPNFIQIGIGNATEEDPEKTLLVVAQRLSINNVGLLYGAADLVPEDIAPALNTGDWRQSKLLVKMNMRLPVSPEKYWLGDAFVAAHQAVCVARDRVDAETLLVKGYALANDADDRFQIWRMPVQPNVIVTLPIPYDGRYA